LVAEGDLSQQCSKNGVRIQLGNGENIVEGAAWREHLVPVSPSSGGSRMPADELAPLSIERLDDAESSPSARCAGHSDDFAQRVLSTVLVETLLVSPILARCCQHRNAHLRSALGT
jgi:hypothetical protein